MSENYMNYFLVVVGLAVVIFNGAATVMRADVAKKLFGIRPKEKYLRVTFVLAGCVFIIFGILGIFGIVNTHIR